MKRFISFTALVSGVALAISSAAQKDEFTTVLDGFQQSLAGQADLDPSVSDALGKLAANDQLDAGALTGLLRKLHPEFGEALRAAADDPAAGVAALEELANSQDPYLAAESSYYLARVLIGDERFEEALPHLEKIRTQWADKSLRAGESLYYQGVCNANMLQRTDAADNLNDFVEQYPDASPRLVGSAWDLIASIERVHRGSIDDVASHMEFSRRKLGLTDAGDVTQEVQGHIITMLDELIAMAEQQEQQQQPP
jgi:tetratricopeptide (TPR) repeat protein